MIKRSFIGNSLVNVIAGALPLASGLILLPFYSNWLTESQFGILALYIAFTLFMQILFNLGFDNLISVSYIENKNDLKKQREVISTIAMGLIFTGIFLILVLLFFGDNIIKVFSGNTGKGVILSFLPYGLMSIITAFFNSFFKTYTILIIYQQKSLKYITLNLINFLLTIAISLGWLYSKKYSLDGPMYGRLLSGVAIFLIAIFFFVKEYGIKFRIDYFGTLAKLGSYFVIYQLLSWMLSYIDRYLIAGSLSTTDVAIYDFILKCLVVIEFITSGLTSAILPNVFNYWTGQDHIMPSAPVNRYFNGFTLVICLMIPAYAIILMLALPLIQIKEWYFNSYPFVPILAAGFIFVLLRQIYSWPLLFKKRSAKLTVAFAYSAVLQILFMSIGLRYFGLWGLIWAGFLAKPFQILFMYLESRKYATLNLSFKKQFLLPLISISTVIIFSLVLGYEHYYLILLIQLFVTLIAGYWVYKNEIPMMIDSLKDLFQKTFKTAKAI